MIRTESTLEDVAFEVCTVVDAVGVTAVLSGGSAATVYAPKAYQSRDLDFILHFHSRGDSFPDQCLLDLGFTRSVRSMFSHPLIAFTLDFMNGPLSVGGDVVDHWLTRRREQELLHIISPTDCVRDRLSAAIHWNDESSLMQAVAVAKEHDVDLGLIQKWCEREGGTRQFSRFRTHI